MIDVRVPLIVLFSVFSANLAAETLHLSNAWVRAMPPGQKMTAVYLEAHNPAESAVSITGASSTVGMASLHETRLEEGRSTMQAVSGLTVEPGAVVNLKPGGLHIMLMGMQNTPAEGDVVPVCLQTSEGDVCTDAPVMRAAPASNPASTSNSGHDHH